MIHFNCLSNDRHSFPCLLLLLSCSVSHFTLLSFHNNAAHTKINIISSHCLPFPLKASFVFQRISSTCLRPIKIKSIHSRTQSQIPPGLLRSFVRMIYCRRVNALELNDGSMFVHHPQNCSSSQGKDHHTFTSSHPDCPPFVGLTKL